MNFIQSRIYEAPEGFVIVVLLTVIIFVVCSYWLTLELARRYWTKKNES